eukprot:7386242-Prymnesium_polylepis.1
MRRSGSLGTVETAIDLTTGRLHVIVDGKTLALRREKLTLVEQLPTEGAGAAAPPAPAAPAALAAPTLPDGVDALALAAAATDVGLDQPEKRESYRFKTSAEYQLVGFSHDLKRAFCKCSKAGCTDCPVSIPTIHTENLPSKATKAHGNGTGKGKAPTHPITLEHIEQAL